MTSIDLRKNSRAFGWFAITVDGHNYVALLDAFEQCRQHGGTQPRAVIAKTFKGKGVSMLENLDGWHGKPVPKQDLPKALAELEKPQGPNEFVPNPRTGFSVPRFDGKVAIQVNRKQGELAATREAYGDGLVKVADQDPRIVALDGDTKNSTFSEKLLKAHPKRFFEMFIAEQNMVGAATGLAARGKIPFVSTFAAFLTRAFDQIRMAGVSHSNVKFCGSHAGVSIGEDGPSQMALRTLQCSGPFPARSCFTRAMLCRRSALSSRRQPNGAFFISGRAGRRQRCFIQTTKRFRLAAENRAKEREGSCYRRRSRDYGS